MSAVPAQLAEIRHVTLATWGNRKFYKRRRHFDFSHFSLLPIKTKYPVTTGARLSAQDAAPL
jgi:hypothetical protein